MKVICIEMDGSGFICCHFEFCPRRYSCAGPHLVLNCFMKWKWLVAQNREENERLT
jgi:hypothetical protein